MAVTFTLEAVTPNMLRYAASSGAGPETGTLANATLLADAIPGSPLHRALSTVVANQAAARALLFGDTFDVEAQLGTAGASLAVGVDANASANALTIEMRFEATSADGDSHLTIRHWPTITR